MKTIRYCNETLTVAGFVTPEGYGLIEKNGPDLKMEKPFKKVFCGPETKSIQTAAAIMASLRKKTIDLEQIKDFKSLHFGNLLLKSGFFSYRREQENNFLDSFYNFFRPMVVSREEKLCADALKNCFANLADGQNGLAINSARHILLAANHFNPEKRLTFLGELDYIDFVCDDQGIITAAPKKITAAAVKSL